MGLRVNFWWCLVGFLIACGLVGVVILPGFVATKVRERAEKLGISMDIGESEMSLKGVILKHLQMTSREFPNDNCIVEQLNISPTFQISVRGIKGSIHGKIEEKIEQFKKWKTRHQGPSGKSSSKEISVENLDIDWDGLNKKDDRLRARGIKIKIGKDFSIKIHQLNALIYNKSIEFIDIENTDSKNILIKEASLISHSSAEATNKDIEQNSSQKITSLIQNLHEYVFQITAGEFYLPGKQILAEKIILDSHWPKPKLSTKHGSMKDEDLVIRWSDLNTELDFKDQESSGEAKTNNLSIRYPRLSQSEVKIESAKISGSLLPNKTNVKISVGNAQIDINIEKSDSGRKLEINVPLIECQELIESIPESLIPKISKIKASGMFKAGLDISFVREKPIVVLRLQNHCKIDPISIPYELDVKNLKKPFKHMIYGPQGQISFGETGPGTKDWVPFDRMSPFLESAARTTEDPGFRESNGFSTIALENSIRDDIMTGKFFRGASTVSMQLAKNLWLNREKTLSRKIQEAILTTYLEQNLTKDEILEYYFNIVEFGPNLYGIGPATKHYFSIDPSSLRLSQALYLVSLLPNPKYQNADAKGHVTDKYMKYLHSLMALMKERKTINDLEYKAGITEWVVLGSPIPEHRPADQLDSNIPEGLRMEDWE
jgi:hypothetical protein